MTVDPSTTWLFSDRPLKAATVRVVRLLAAAIDHSVSPGCTVCGTAAWAGAAMDRNAARTGSTRRTRTLTSLFARIAVVILVTAAPPGNLTARCYDASQRALRRH